MAKSELKDYMLRNGGSVALDCVKWSYKFENSHGDSQGWSEASLEITPKGELIMDGDAVMIPSLQKCEVQLFPELRVLKVKSLDLKTVFIKTQQSEFEPLLACLMVWQNLKPQGYYNKYSFNKSIVHNENLQTNDLLVCRFRIYGPAPNYKKVQLSELPKTPLYPSEDKQTEGWFTAMGYLKRDGILDLLCENDGTLLYSVDITKLYSSEIRPIHHSVFQQPNILFVGQINELRRNHRYANEIDSEDDAPFILKNGKSFSDIHRILIQFDLGIDLRDWIVALKTFTKLEYIGNRLTKDRMRLVKNYKLEVVEAKFNNPALNENLHLYVELHMWGGPWYRTAIVKNLNQNPFWKELFDLDLPPSAEFFKLVLKSSNNSSVYNLIEEDPVIAGAFVTPDFMTEPQMMKKLPLYGDQSHEIGSVTINLSLREIHIMSYKNYRMLEGMMKGIDVRDLLRFVTPLIEPQNVDDLSQMLLDIYQSANMEHEYFEQLMSFELESLKDSGSKLHSISPTNNLNTLFRGRSLLSVSLEKYQIRIGQEYLEKLLGEFIAQIGAENLICDPNPKTYPNTHEEHYQNLLNYVEELWNRIYTTSNDLPEELKREWGLLRSKVEHSVDPSDTETPLNALCSFIFLRFLCPAILNPKLFNLSKNHQQGTVSKTLTLIAKVLMTLANRSQFAPHKDPELLRLNEDFLNKRSSELRLYCDRVSGRKMDFTEKKLEMTNAMGKPSLTASEEILSELPSRSYLIDKYLRLAEFASLLDSNNSENIVSKESKRKSVLSELKLDLLGLEDTDFGSRDFIKTLLEDGDDELNQLILEKQSINLEDLKRQASVVIAKTKAMEQAISETELPSDFTTDTFMEFVNSILKAARVDQDHCVVYDLMGNDNGSLESYLKHRRQSADSPRLKSKHLKEQVSKSGSVQSVSTLRNSISSASLPSPKSTFKKLFKRRSIT
ncbi:hypothetical protein KL935_000022 [Ogataea polymorpha]|nr:hypothetical protein KL935_000022 [Ogataea polymorpha]